MFRAYQNYFQRIKTIYFIYLFAITCCAVWRPKVSPYLIHSADYILFRSFEMSKDIQSVQDTHV